VGDLERNLNMKYRDFRRSLSPPSHEEFWIISPLIPMLQEKTFSKWLGESQPTDSLLFQGIDAQVRSLHKSQPLVQSVSG
jgi:hypothetical protein